MNRSSLIALSLMLAGTPMAVAADFSAENNKVYRAYNTPVNYNFYEAFFGGGRLYPDDGSNEDITELGVEFHRMINRGWVFDFDYEGRFIHGDDYDVRNDRASMGARYRYGVNEHSDVLAGIRMGAMRSKAERRGSGSTIYSDTDFMYGINLGYRYGFSKKLEGGAELEYLDASHLDETVLTFDMAYYKTKFFGFGGYVSQARGDKSETREYGVLVRFRFK